MLFVDGMVVTVAKRRVQLPMVVMHFNACIPDAMCPETECAMHQTTLHVVIGMEVIVV